MLRVDFWPGGAGGFGSSTFGVSRRSFRPCGVIIRKLKARTRRQERASFSTGSSQPRTSFFSGRVRRQRFENAAVAPMWVMTRPNMIFARSHNCGIDGMWPPTGGGSGGS